MQQFPENFKDEDIENLRIKAKDFLEKVKKLPKPSEGNEQKTLDYYNQVKNLAQDYYKEVNRILMEKRIENLNLGTKSKEILFDSIEYILTKNYNAHVNVTLPIENALLIKKHNLENFNENIADIYNLVFSRIDENILNESAGNQELASLFDYLETKIPSKISDTVQVWSNNIKVDKELANFDSEKILEESLVKTKNTMYQCLLLIPKNKHPNVQSNVEEGILENFTQPLFEPMNHPDYCHVHQYNNIAREFKIGDGSEVVTAWNELKNAFNNLSAEKSTQVRLLKAMFEFMTKAGVLNKKTPDKNEYYDDALGLRHAFNKYLSNNGLSLELDASKREILKQILAQIDKLSTKSSEFRKLMNDIKVEIVKTWPGCEDNAKYASSIIKDELLQGSMLSLLALLSLPEYCFKDENDKKLEFNEIDCNINSLPLIISYFQEQGSAPNIEESKISIIAKLQAEKSREDEKNNLKNKTLKPSSAIGVLQRLDASSLSVGNNLDLEGDSHKQAAFKFNGTESVYKISDEEAQLLAKMIGLNDITLVRVKRDEKTYPKNCLSYEELSAKFSAEIKVREDKNNKGFRRIFGFIPGVKYPVNALSAAKDYIILCREKSTDIKELEVRLQQNKHRTAVTKGNAIRAYLTGKAKSLSSVYKINRQFKQLNALFVKKSKYSHILKPRANLLTPTLQHGLSTKEKTKQINILKNQRNQITFNNLANKKMFEPVALQSTSFLFEVPNEKIKIKNLYSGYSDMKQLKVKYHDLILKAFTHGNTFKQKIYKATNNDFEQYKKSTLTELQEKISQLNSQVNSMIKNGDHDYHQKYVDLITQVAALVDIAQNKFLEQIYEAKYFTLDNFKEIYKTEIYTQKFLMEQKCEMPNNFYVRDKDALKKIGKRLGELKDSQKDLKFSALTYLNALGLQINAKEEVYEFLTTLEDVGSADRIKKIKEQAEGYSKNIGFIELSRFSENVGLAKFGEMAKDLNKIAKQLEKNDDFNLILNNYKKTSNSLKQNKTKEEDKVKNLLDGAKETVQTFSYYADHTTRQLPGIK